MKYIITEDRINKIIDKIFLNRYGGLLKKDVVDFDYIDFLDNQNKKAFELNQAGTLWVNDYIFLKTIRRIFGMRDNELINLFKNYFKERYNVNVVNVASEGGYYREGDNPDDSDPWLDPDD